MTRETRAVAIGEKGRVVIPAEVRAVLGVSPGDEVLFVVEEGEVRLTTRREVVRRLRGAFRAPDGRSLTDELLAERRAEAEARGW